MKYQRPLDIDQILRCTKYIADGLSKHDSHGTRASHIAVNLALLDPKIFKEMPPEQKAKMPSTFALMLLVGDAMPEVMDEIAEAELQGLCIALCELYFTSDQLQELLKRRRKEMIASHFGKIQDRTHV